MRRLAIILAASALAACSSVRVEPPPVRTGEVTPQMAWDDGQQAYLHWNSTRLGWKILESGVQAKRIAGQGKGEHPKPTDTVTLHYEGRLIDGTVFDSSYQRNQPATFPLPALIRGWQAGVPLMRRGETWELVIPASYAYGGRAQRGIPANSALIFKIELIDFRS